MSPLRRVDDPARFGWSYTCPICGMTSFNPHDVIEGYCGYCCDWTRGRLDPGLEALRADPQIIWSARCEDDDFITVTRMATGYRVTRGANALLWDEAWDYPPAELGDDAMPKALLNAQALLHGREPMGWYRHHPSGRRRPGGDPAREEIRQ